ncbi:MAG TPA: hypothetical protein VHM01_10495 [Alphaproteobacteria bacterium]|nr:hypothetical protein [Alphaproteobacteria bacterium]
MSSILLRDALISVVVATVLLAATSLRAQGPAVEIEGYYAQATLHPLDRTPRPAQPTQADAAANARGQTIDVERLAPHRDDTDTAVVAHLKATPTPR